MDEFESALKKLGFTQYEAQALIALIKFKDLDAPSITQHSGVPQPKVYETMEKLYTRGLVEKVPLGRKWVYTIKPQSLLEKRIEEIVSEFSHDGQFILTSINSVYGTEKGFEIPFVGVAGEENIVVNLAFAIMDARESVSTFIPHYLFQESVIASLSDASEKFPVEVICREESHAQELVEQLPNAQIYLLETQAFETIKHVEEMIRSILPPEQKESFGFGLIQNLLQNISDIFGLAVFDQRKSFFLVPVPLGIPSAIVSTLPEMLQFHSQGIQEILKSCRRIE